MICCFHVEYIFILLARFRFSFTTCYWLSWNISEKESARRLIIYGGHTINAGQFIFYGTRSESGLHAASFYRDWMLRLISRRLFRFASQRNRRGFHRSLLRSHVTSARSSTHPVKMSRTNATLKQKCWFEFVIHTYTRTRTRAHTVTTVCITIIQFGEAD